MRPKRRRLRRILALLATLVVLFLATGALNDWNARRVHRHHNHIGADGIAERARTQDLLRGSDTLVALVHGFGATPQVYDAIALRFTQETDADLWLPLLAQHGRSLDDFRAFDPPRIRADLLARLEARAANYERVVVVAHSFGGAMVADLLARGALPANVTPILFAPAVHILGDDDTNRLSLHAFGLWASYCDIVAFGCDTPNPASAGPTGIVELYATNYFFYLVVAPILALFDYADGLAEPVAAIAAPVNIVMAHDDARVDFPATQAMCAAMAACRMHVLPLGSHNPQFSTAGSTLAALLIRLAEDPDATCEGLDCVTE